MFTLLSTPDPPEFSTKILLEIVRFLNNQVEGEWREGPAVEFSKLRKRLDPGQPERVELREGKKNEELVQ